MAKHSFGQSQFEQQLFTYQSSLSLIESCIKRPDHEKIWVFLTNIINIRCKTFQNEYKVPFLSIWPVNNLSLTVYSAVFVQMPFCEVFRNVSRNSRRKLKRNFEIQAVTFLKICLDLFILLSNVSWNILGTNFNH